MITNKEKEKFDKVKMSLYLDFYGGLLKQNTLKILDEYINQDLSLSEIAESMNITRQAIHDRITKGYVQLRQYEDELLLIKKWTQAKTQLMQLKKFIMQEDRESALKAINTLIKEIDD